MLPPAFERAKLNSVRCLYCALALLITFYLQLWLQLWPELYLQFHLIPNCLNNLGRIIVAF